MVYLRTPLNLIQCCELAMAMSTAEFELDLANNVCGDEPATVLEIKAAVVADKVFRLLFDNPSLKLR